MDKDEFVKTVEEETRVHINNLTASPEERGLAERELERIAFRNAGLRR